MLTRILLHGKAFIFVYDGDRNSGAISTEKQYREGLRSYAHLFRDGRILRLSEQIGTREDIQWGEGVHIIPTPEATCVIPLMAWLGVDDTVDIA